MPTKARFTSLTKQVMAYLLVSLCAPISATPLPQDLVLSHDIQQTSAEVNSTSALSERQNARYLLYCGGRAGEGPDGISCGGPCTRYNEGDPIIWEDGIYAPRTNCLETDGTWAFRVCNQGVLSEWACTGESKFVEEGNYGITNQGRYVYPTRQTIRIDPFYPRGDE